MPRATKKATPVVPWEIKLAMVAPQLLIANPLNFRTHPASQRRNFNAAVRAVGVIDRIKVNKNTNRIVDGHLRAEEAIAAGVPEIPVQWLDLTPEEEKLALLTFDPLGAQAEEDKDTLDALMRDAETTDPVLMEMIDALATEHGLVPPHGGTEEEAAPEADKNAGYKEQYGVIVVCRDEAHQQEVFETLQGEGLEVRIVVT